MKDNESNLKENLTDRLNQVFYLHNYIIDYQNRKLQDFLFFKASFPSKYRRILFFRICTYITIFFTFSMAIFIDSIILLLFNSIFSIITIILEIFFYRIYRYRKSFYRMERNDLIFYMKWLKLLLKNQCLKQILGNDFMKYNNKFKEINVKTDDFRNIFKTTEEFLTKYSFPAFFIAIFSQILYFIYFFYQNQLELNIYILLEILNVFLFMIIMYRAYKSYPIQDYNKTRKDLIICKGIFMSLLYYVKYLTKTPEDNAIHKKISEIPKGMNKNYKNKSNKKQMKRKTKKKANNRSVRDKS